LYILKDNARNRGKPIDPAHDDLFVLGPGLLLSLFELSPGYRRFFIKGLKSSPLGGFRSEMFIVMNGYDGV